MSKDFQIAFPCTHRAVLEPVQLLSDRRSLNTSIDVVAVEEVRLNGIVVPPEGLLTPAAITSGLVAPFRFYSDALDLKVSLAGASYNVTFDAGLVFIEDVIKKLNVTDAYTATQDNGRIVLRDNLYSGPGSRISVSGTAAASLGFSEYAGASGREVCSGWGLAKVAGTDQQKPMLMYPSKFGQSARWEVTYLMDPNRCRRCMSSRIENDFRFRASGDPAMVQDENLLYQMAMKAVLTIKGSNKYHRWYGSSVMRSIGGRTASAVVGSVRTDLEDCLKKVISLQQEQAKYQGVSRKEQIIDVLGVNVQQHKDDPSTLLVDISVKNAAYRTVSLSIVFSVPGAVGTVNRDGKIIGRLGSNTYHQG